MRQIRNLPALPYLVSIFVVKLTSTENNDEVIYRRCCVFESALSLPFVLFFKAIDLLQFSHCLLLFAMVHSVISLQPILAVNAKWSCAKLEQRLPSLTRKETSRVMVQHSN